MNVAGRRRALPCTAGAVVVAVGPGREQLASHGGAMQCEPGIPVLFKEASFLFQQQQCAQLLQTGKVGPFLYCSSAGNPEFPCEHIFRINFAYMQRKLVRRKVVSKGKSKPLRAERGLCCSSWPRVSVNAGLQLTGSYSARVSVLQHL